MVADIKPKIFKKGMNGCGLRPEEVMCRGDDMPDYEVMQMSGLPV